MLPPIDLHRLRMPGLSDAPQPQPRTPPRHRKGEKFLKGPIPLGWLVQAARLPGRALHVGVALWHQAGLTRASQVPLSMKLMRSMGVERSSVYRGLHALEDAQLVAVARRRGHKPKVTILPAPQQDGTTAGD
jgi:hypothetical protein